jgi:hypothetical protein
LSLSQDQLNALARHGAQARINELRQEIAAIEQAFPGLGAKRRGRPRKQSSSADGSAASTGVSAKARRRSRGWSAAQRKAAAQRMKAYWVKRKAGRKK